MSKIYCKNKNTCQNSTTDTDFDGEKYQCWACDDKEEEQLAGARRFHATINS